VTNVATTWKRAILVPIVLALGCRPETQDALHTESSGVERGVIAVEVEGPLQPYVAGLDELGGLALRNRFRELGNAHRREVYPDTAACHGWFATPQGTYCFWNGTGGPFAIRPVDPYVASPAGTEPLVSHALRRADLDLRAIPREAVEAPGLLCVSFYVWHIDEPVASLNEENLWGRPDTRWADGLSCVLDGDTLSLVEGSSDGADGIDLWDVIRVDGERHVVVARVPHEWSYLQLYRVTSGKLSLVTSLDPMDLEAGPDSAGE